MTNAGNAAPAIKSVRRKRHVDTSTSRMITTTFSVWGANLGMFAALTLLVFSPYVAWVSWAHLSASEGAVAASQGMAGGLAAWVLHCVVSVPVIYAVLEQLRHGEVRLGEALSRGLSRLPSALAVGVLTGLCCALCFLPAFFVTKIFVQPPSILLSLPTLIAVMVVASGLFLALPVVVIERCRPLDALVRSWKLTEGHKARIFLLLFVFYLLGYLLSVAGGYVSLLFAEASVDGHWSVDLALILVSASVGAVLTAVTYFDVRTRAEDVDLGDLASVPS